MIRAVYARSIDGWAAKSNVDKMDWTGGDDKAIFRTLTSVGGIIGVGSTTHDLLPGLTGRKAIRITRRSTAADPGMSLMQFAARYPDGWLAGGPTLLQAAFEMGIIGEVHECVVQLRLGEQGTEGFIPAPTIPHYLQVAMETHWEDNSPTVIHRVHRARVL